MFDLFVKFKSKKIYVENIYLQFQSIQLAFHQTIVRIMIGLSMMSFS